MISPPKYLPLQGVLCLVVISGLMWSPSLFRLFAVNSQLFLLPIAWILFVIYYLRVPKTGLAASNLRRRIAVAAVLGGLSVVVVGAFLLTFKIAWLGILLAVSGLALLHLGVVPWTRVFASISPIWIAWPWPAGFYERVDSFIHGLGVQTATSTLDLLGVPLFNNGMRLEFRQQSLETGVWMNGPDSFVGLLLFAVLTLVWGRRTIVPSLLTLLAVPFVAWMGEAARILIWYWTYSSFAFDLSEGWPLICLRLGVFGVQLILILMVNWGVHWALMPVLTAPDSRTNVSVHSIYNMLVLWPLKISASARQADQEYLEDFDDDDRRPKTKTSLVTRRMPDIQQARQAPDPWANPKLRWSTVAVGGLAVILSLAANLLPPAKSVSLPTYDAASVAALATESLFEGVEIPALFTNSTIRLEGEQSVIDWNFAGSSGSVVFMARLPSLAGMSAWTSPNEMVLNGPVKPLIVDSVTIYEAAFLGQLGGKSTGWFAAMLPTGQSLGEPGIMSRIKGRLVNSLLGRLTGFTDQQLTYETALLVDSTSGLTERQRQEFRLLFAKLSKQLARSVQEIQP